MRAPLRQGYKEDVAPDVFAEDRQQLGAADFVESGSLDVACSRNAKVSVALDECLEKVSRSSQPAQHDQSRNRQKHSPRPVRWTPPGIAHTGLPASAKTSSAGDATPHLRRAALIGVLHLQGHAGQRASQRRRTLPDAPDAGFRGRVIFPREGTVFVTALYRHA